MMMNDDKSVRQYPMEEKDGGNGNLTKVSKGVKKGLRYDPELYEYIVASFNRSKKVIEERGIFKKARKYSKIYENGDVWRAMGIQRAKHLTKMMLNIAFDVVEAGVNIVTARVPMPEIKPTFDSSYPPYQKLIEKLSIARAEQNFEMEEQAKKEYDELKKRISSYAAKLKKELIDVWRDTKMQTKIRILYREKAKTGVSFIKSVYNPDKGRIENELCDIQTQYPSPNVPTIGEHLFEPYIYAPVVSIKEISRKYHIDSRAIEEAAIGSLSGFDYGNDLKSGWLAKITAAVKNVFGRKNREAQYVQPLECYMPADENKDVVEHEEETIAEDENGNIVFDENNNIIKEIVKVIKPKFPSGHKRVTVILNHYGWIIDEADNPYKRPPFFHLKNYEQLGDFYGISELQNIEDIIWRIDISASNIHDNLRYTGNPKLVKSKDATGVKYSNNVETPEPITSGPGGIINEQTTGSVRYLQPPQLGFDAKWWLGWLKEWLDRISRIPDSLRGFNENATDSGKKVQLLRSAALGSFQSKVDEQIEFCHELYEHWVWIYQNVIPEDTEIIHRMEDDYGDANYEEFNPSEGRDLKLKTYVAQQSILPDDPYSKWEEALQLFSLKLEDGITPLISEEHLIDLAPTIEDKARIKRYLAKKQEEISRQKQLQSAMEEFRQLAGQYADAAEEHKGTEVEDKVFNAIYQIVKQFPEIMNTPEYQALPQRIKLAVATQISLGETPQLEAGNNGQDQEQNVGVPLANSEVQQ